MIRLWIAVCFLLTGCGADHIQTTIYSPFCIKPFYAYKYQTCCNIEFSINGYHFEIPPGFETDLASIPKFVWPIMSPAHSSLIPAAIVHDWFYRKTCDFSRKDADLIFYHMLKNDGIGTFRASMMYYAVRLFGWQFYNEDYCD